MTKSFKNFLRIAVGLAIAFSASVSNASDIGVSADIGTTGAGLHLSAPVTQSVNGRVGFGLFNYSKSLSTDSVDYDAKLKFQSIDILADWFPFESSGFRVTGGAVLNFNKVDASARPKSGNYTVNGHSYSSAQAGNIDGRISFNKVAPYFGVGYGGARASSSNWGLTADVGVMFQGSPSSSLTNSNCTAGAAACSTLANDLAAENQKLRDKTNNYQYWPVVRVGLWAKF